MASEINASFCTGNTGGMPDRRSSQLIEGAFQRVVEVNDEFEVTVIKSFDQLFNRCVQLWKH